MLTTQLQLSDFSQAVGSLFQVCTESVFSCQLELLEAVKLGDRPSNSSTRSESFSLLFKGPQDIFLPQKIWLLNHSTLGDISLFLVPISQDDDGFCYEAIFT